MFVYRAITANCGNDTLGKNASTRIAKLLRGEQEDDSPLDFCVINCQEVYFQKAKKELEQAFIDADLEGYSVSIVGKMPTPTKVDSFDDIQNAVFGNTGMASFVIHKNNIKVNIDSVQEARRNPWAKAGTAYNKGGLVSRCTMTKNSEVMDIELVSGHLDSNNMMERAQDWGGILQKLALPSNQIKNFKALSKAVAHIRLSGYDANTRNKLINGASVNLWREKAFELDGLKQAALGGGRFSADSTYKTEDKTSITAPSPEKKRRGYTRGGMLDFVVILDGAHQFNHAVETKEVITIGSDDASTKRDHAVVISPKQEYKPSAPFCNTRDQIAAMLEQSAPILANNLRALHESKINEALLLDVYKLYLSQDGLLNQALTLFKDKLDVVQRVNKQKPSVSSDIQTQLFPPEQAGPWFQSVSLNNFKQEAKKIQQQQALTQSKINDLVKQYPSGFNAMKAKLLNTINTKAEVGKYPPDANPSASYAKTMLEGEVWDLEQASELYTTKFSQETWYQAPKKTEDGDLNIPFPDEKTAMAFSEEIAKKGLSFIVVDDATGQVLAYAKGDGVLNHNDEHRALDEIRSDFHEQKHTP
ncbi:MAG: hypothetical protein P1U36_01665 [Legionellaceae bacterium]|nr:hypothetical protein [Legionellaceae bacterium]